MMFFPLNQKGHFTGQQILSRLLCCRAFAVLLLRYTITATCSAPHPAKNFAGEKSGLGEMSSDRCRICEYVIR